MKAKDILCSIAALVGGTAAKLLGGWDAAITALILFMIVDFISGLTVAGIFKRSSKSQNGALDSKAGFRGLCKKGMMLAFVTIGCRLDMAMNTEYIRDAVCIGFMANELISIIENAGMMGIPIPSAITKAIDVLKSSNPQDYSGKNTKGRR